MPAAKRKPQTPLDRAGDLISKFDGMVKEQVVLGGIMGADQVLTVPQLRTKIAEECKHTESTEDLFELLTIKQRPCSADTRKRIQHMMTIPPPHTSEQVEAVAAAEAELCMRVAAAIDFSQLDKLHTGLKGVETLMASFGLNKSKDEESDTYVKFEGDAGRIVKSSEPEPESKVSTKARPSYAAPTRGSKRSRKAGAEVVKTTVNLRSAAVKRHGRDEQQQEDGATVAAEMVQSADQLRVAEKVARQRAKREEKRKLQAAAIANLKRLGELSMPKVYSQPTESPNLVGDAASHNWSMWSMWNETYEANRPGSESVAAERSIMTTREETMSAAKGVYFLDRGAAAGSPRRRRRRFKQTDSDTIIGFPEQPFMERAISDRESALPPADVVGSWQWGRPQSERGGPRDPTQSKVRPLAPPAFAREKCRTAEEAVFVAVSEHWREDVPALLRAAAADGATQVAKVAAATAAAAASGHPDSTTGTPVVGADSVVAVKETALRNTASALDGYRHDAVAQLMAESARLAELSPRTQRRLVRLRPLRMTE